MITENPLAKKEHVQTNVTAGMAAIAIQTRGFEVRDALEGEIRREAALERRERRVKVWPREECFGRAFLMSAELLVRTRASIMGGGRGKGCTEGGTEGGGCGKEG